jgi:hypothetical protein
VPLLYAVAEPGAGDAAWHVCPCGKDHLTLGTALPKLDGFLHNLTLPDEVTWDAAEVADAASGRICPRCSDPRTSRLGRPCLLRLKDVLEHLRQGGDRRCHSLQFQLDESAAAGDACICAGTGAGI